MSYIPNKTVPFSERAYCHVDEGCSFLGCGRTTMFALIDIGEVESFLWGQFRMLSVPSVLRAAERIRQGLVPTAAEIKRQRAKEHEEIKT